MAVRLLLFFILFLPSHNLYAEEISGTGRFMDKAYQHTLTMGQHAPLPAKLKVQLPPELYLQTVRALLVIDDQLIALDLKFDKDSHSFSGDFPTPREELRYQFQMIDTYNTSLMSQLYRAAPPCNSYRLEKLKGKEYVSDKQQELIIQSLELKVKNDTLKYAINTLEEVLKERKKPEPIILEREPESES